MSSKKKHNTNSPQEQSDDDDSSYYFFFPLLFPTNSSFSPPPTLSPKCFTPSLREAVPAGIVGGLIFRVISRIPLKGPLRTRPTPLLRFGASSFLAYFAYKAIVCSLPSFDFWHKIAAAYCGGVIMGLTLPPLRLLPHISPSNIPLSRRSPMKYGLSFALFNICYQNCQTILCNIRLSDPRYFTPSKRSSLPPPPSYPPPSPIQASSDD